MNITEKDLMVGDLVQYGDIHTVKTRVLAISSVDNGKHWHIQVEPECPNSMRIVAMHAVEPIPLTVEILRKNGFIIKKKWAQIGNFGDSPLIMWHFIDDPILRNYSTELEIHQNDTGKVHIHIPCKYVHELQHALRLCGIDKEIKL